ncbi:hypothetical protein C8F01DRAFT_1095213 [Mycena amicta]|nr:hypothetical protein C8F01DRAFT_1095213 [Mycena amicta]
MLPCPYQLDRTFGPDNEPADNSSTRQQDILRKVLELHPEEVLNAVFGPHRKNLRVAIGPSNLGIISSGKMVNGALVIRKTKPLDADVKEQLKLWLGTRDGFYKKRGNKHIVRDPDDRNARLDAQKGEQDWSDFMVPYLHARGRRRPKWAWAAVGWLDRVLPYVFKGPGSRYDPFKVIDESDDDDARRLKRKARDESDGEIQPSRQKKNKSLGMIDLTL